MVDLRIGEQRARQPFGGDIKALMRDCEQIFGLRQRTRGRAQFAAPLIHAAYPGADDPADVIVNKRTDFFAARFTQE